MLNFAIDFKAMSLLALLATLCNIDAAAAQLAASDPREDQREDQRVFAGRTADSTELNSIESDSTEFNSAEFNSTVAEARPDRLPPADAAMSQVNSVSQLASEPQIDRQQSLSQVTSVSQLSDVQPTDWAFQALQSLVERYGCIAGYPDGTYRGQRALTRFEFAAGLNACLDRINEIIQAELADAVTEQDLASVRRLQEEFAAELATLRGRVDALEARTAELEANQFSTTTTLRGELILGLSGASGAYPGADEEDATPAILSNTEGRPGEDAQIALNYRLRLNLTTSFTGRDALITGLQAYNFRGDPNSIQGVLGYSDPQPVDLNASNVRLGFEPQFPGVNPQDLTARTANNLELYKLLYVFPGFDNVTFFVGTNAEVTDAFPSVSPFASDTQGAVSRFAPYNAAVRVSGGTSGSGLASAAGFIWNISDSVNLTALYGNVNASIPGNRGLAGGTPLGAGIFGGSSVVAAQLTVTPFERLRIGFNYANSYHQINILGTGLSSSDIGSILFQPNADQLAAVDGNAVLAIANEPIRLNSIGATANWQFLDNVSLVLSGAYIFADLVNVDASTNFVQWSAGLHFQDIFADGNSAGILFGQPLNRDSIDGAAFNLENTDPYHLEGYLSFRVTDNITITPGAFAVFNPEGYSGNDTAIVGVLRTAFTF